MQKYKMFAAYLNEQLVAKGMTIPELSKKLGYVILMHVPTWFRGTGLPMATELKKLAEILDADPIVLSIGWLVAQAPELEEVMTREILADRVEKLPGHC